ncbi:putative Amastin surface glycoprotein [Leishmania naiffi]|uniref:Amastin surface glycoprotein n=1 Tax=Leishmania naiffi TaxID=5678 RepID=A0AAW3B473_9TRYP
MLFIRFILLALILLFFVIALIGTTPLPLYSSKITNYNQNGKVEVSLWFIKVGTVSVTGENVTEVPTSSPVRINYAGCEEFRSVFRSMQAFAIGGTVFGFYAVLVSCLQCFCHLKVKLPLFIFIFLATLCELCVILIAGVAYGKEFCPSLARDGNLTTIIFKGAGYKLDSAFSLHVIALVGYTICLIITPFTQQLWCGKA